MEIKHATQNLKNILKSKNIEASAPCRIDMGGTLDINTFYYPLRHLAPCTFNIAIDLRTVVRLFPYHKDHVKVTSRGFESAEYPLDKAPFNHPLGLMFAIAVYFGAGGVHIDIDSSSPPRSALGGSSAAAVALIAAFSTVFAKESIKPLQRKNIALLAYALEGSVAGVPCGLQDQLAAAYGGVNAWYWKGSTEKPFFKKRIVVKKSFLKNMEQHLLLAYCGVPHESKNINNRWVQQFLSGKYRELWAEIVICTKEFVNVLAERNFQDASALMNRETALRRRMTPAVLDEIGKKLTDSAMENNCGARFTGAGGGGCIWALGEAVNIDKLKVEWEEIVSKRKNACLLDVKIDGKGLLVNTLIEQKLN